MATYAPGTRVLVNISAGLAPGTNGAPDWQPGTIAGEQAGLYRVRLDQPIAGREAEKDALPEHIRPLSG